MSLKSQAKNCGQLAFSETETTATREFGIRFRSLKFSAI